MKNSNKERLRRLAEKPKKNKPANRIVIYDPNMSNLDHLHMYPGEAIIAIPDNGMREMI
jgi:hypothetical protein